MDILKMLRELHEEKKRLDAAIAGLEADARAKTAKFAVKDARRGRKSMSRKERLDVSRRMAEYWKNRRIQQSERSAQASDRLSSPTSDRSS